jgi:hypothetical protein
LLLRRVIAQLVAFGPCQDAEKGRIAIRHPMAEDKAANEDSDTGKDGIEEVEGPHGAHTNEVEERPFHSQVSEWLVQALKDSVCATLLWSVWHSFLVYVRVGVVGKGAIRPRANSRHSLP